jgi:hypothetical protein
MIHEPGLMQLLTGRVISIKQNTKSSHHTSIGESGAVQSHDVYSELIEIAIDTCDQPFILNTDKTSNFFIGQDDVLDISGIWQGDRFEIYGIRNKIDGSVYLVSPDKVESRKTSYYIIGFIGVGALIMVAYVSIADRLGIDAILQMLAVLAFALVLMFCIFSLGRWGIMSNKMIGEHTQEGDKSEMVRAKLTLGVTTDEQNRVTTL